MCFLHLNSETKEAINVSLFTSIPLFTIIANEILKSIWFYRKLTIAI